MPQYVKVTYLFFFFVLFSQIKKQSIDVLHKTLTIILCFSTTLILFFILII